MIMNRTLGVAGGLVIAVSLLYVLQSSGVASRTPAPSSEGGPTAAPTATSAINATTVAIEDLAAWPAAAGR